MLIRAIVVVGLAAVTIGAVVAISTVGVRTAQAVPAFARQYDLQCNACHTRPPRLNSFGEQFHLMGFQMPSAARPDGIIGAVKEDGPVKTLIDSLALRIVGGIFEYSESPHETEVKFEPPHEIEFFIARALTPDVSLYVELEFEPNAVKFGKFQGFYNEPRFGLGKEAFFMANLGGLFGLLGAPTMEMGGMTMVGRHGGFNMHGPMLMAGKIDPSTNWAYPTNRQLIEETELEVERENDRGEVHRFPVVPYAFTSKFFGLFKNRDEGEPQLVTDQVMYNTRGGYGADFHAMFQNNLLLGQAGILQENEGVNIYGVGHLQLGESRGLVAHLSALVNWGFGVVRAPVLDPDEPDEIHPGSRRLDRLRYGVAANVRWKQLDVYGALIFDQLFGVPDDLRGQFDRDAVGLTLQIDYLAHEKLMLSTRFDQLWAGGLNDQRLDGTVLTVQAKYYPWQNIAFFVRDSVNLREFHEENPLRSWRNQLFVGIDWDF
ncbi:MAG TPA: hypothetical protein VLB49_15075 [Gemmatimonadales bacterium]|nr:hypothetical protein [Gemmatimonadales bacterium]